MSPYCAYVALKITECLCLHIGLMLHSKSLSVYVSLLFCMLLTQSHSHNVRVLLLCCVSPAGVSNHLLLFLTTVCLPSVQNFATTGSSTRFRSANRHHDSYTTVTYSYVDALINFVIRAVSGNSYRFTYNRNSVFNEKVLILVPLSP
jgi:hypothetical protein